MTPDQLSSRSDYVRCPVTITSPAPTPGALALGLEPNMVCGMACHVVREGPLMEFVCPVGHRFVAGTEDVIQP
jgi:hypothetical protein